MKKVIYLLILFFAFVKAGIAGAEKQILNVGKSEILIPAGYQAPIRGMIYRDTNKCVRIRKNKFKIYACFEAGKEFSETLETSNFKDRDPITDRKLPRKVLAHFAPQAIWGIVKMTPIGKYEAYTTDSICHAPPPSGLEHLYPKVWCHIAIVDSPFGISFYVESYFADIEEDTEPAREKQREWTYNFIKSIKILKGEPIKKSQREKVDFKPSFDCSKSRTSVEKTICADEYLSRLDEMLSIFYNALNREENEQLITDQRAWLKHRNACKDADCIQAAYEFRIKKLCEENDSVCSDDDETNYGREIDMFYFP